MEFSMPILLIVIVIALLRLAIINVHGIRAINVIYDSPQWRLLQNEYEPRRDYVRMMFDVRKWTFKQFFPVLEEQETHRAKS